MGTARIDIDGIDDDSPDCGVQVWKALEDRYQHVDQTTKTVLKKQFEALTITAYDTINNFLAGVRAMRRELQVHGINKSNEDTVERILEAARADERYKDVAVARRPPLKSDRFKVAGRAVLVQLNQPV